MGRSDLNEVLSERFPEPHVCQPFKHSVATIRSSENELEQQESLTALIDEFTDIFDPVHGQLKTMKGPDMHIQLENGAKVRPARCLTTRRVPIHLEAEAYKEIQHLIETGVLRKMDEPTEWVSLSAFVVKPDGKSLRLVTNLRWLNTEVERPVHPFPSASDIAGSIPCDSKYFLKLDCVKSCYQIPLDEESVKLTTFLLPFGRFAYNRAPMGLSSSGDEYCRRGDAALHGLEGFKKIVDDILIYGPTKGVVLERETLQRCREHGIALSRKKRLLEKR